MATNRPKAEEAYRDHFKGYADAMRQYDAAMDSPAYDAAVDSLASAIGRVRESLPGEARIIGESFEAIEGFYSDALAALIDAWYHECCRRSLGHKVVASKANARKARKRHAADPKSAAMRAIKIEWEAERRPGRGFARTQAAKYQAQGLDITEGGIKNAISRWRKESSSC